jgi:hypothetical protein
MDTALLEKKLKDAAPEPEHVAVIAVKAGVDSTGDEALWVYVTLAPGKDKLPTREAIRRVFREKAGELAEDVGSPFRPKWVYVRFLKSGELAPE